MAIVYVDSTSFGGYGTSWSDAFPSLNQALEVGNHVPGNIYLVSGTFTETVNIAEVAAATTPTIIQGDDKSNPAGPGKPATFTIDATGLTNAVFNTAGSGVQVHYVFKDMVCQNASGIGFDLGASSDYVTFHRCRFTNNGTQGVRGDTWITFNECTVDNNGSDGVLVDAPAIFVGCSFYGNGGNGVKTTGADTIHVVDSLFYENTSGAIDAGLSSSSGSPIFIYNCTLDGLINGSPTGTGIIANGVRPKVISNSIITNFATGITCDTNMGEMDITRNNLVNNNTVTYVGIQTNTGEITDTPVFVDESNNDYRLHENSPCVAAGVDVGTLVNNVSYRDIGAYQIAAGIGTSNYAENRILDYLFNNDVDWAPATVYLALFASNPREDQVYFGEELFGNAYARQIITFRTAVDGIARNDADILFPVATPSYWETITHFGIFDALTEGNLLFSGKFSSSIDVVAGDQLRIRADNLSIKLS